MKLQAVTIFGLGEAGALFAADLASLGVHVNAYDPADVDTPGGVLRHELASDAVADAEVVLALTGGADAITAINQALQHIPDSALYADFSTNSAETKKSQAAFAQTANLEFVDIAMMTTVPGHGLRTPSLASGDAAFPGLSLRPESSEERWRMRWWSKYLDGYFGPSLSMIGWSIFIGPSVRDKDPEELKRNIDRIPLKERRDAWRMAIYNTFTEEALAESRRHVLHGIEVFEKGLSERPYFAGTTYSLVDINGFCMAHALPLMQAEFVNQEKTPNLIDWLRRVYATPAIAETFKLGRTPMAARADDVRELIGGGDD